MLCLIEEDRYEPLKRAEDAFKNLRPQRQVNRHFPNDEGFFIFLQ